MLYKLPNLMDHMLSETPWTITKSVLCNKSSIATLNFGSISYCFSERTEKKTVSREWDPSDRGHTSSKSYISYLHSHSFVSQYPIPKKYLRKINIALT